MISLQPLTLEIASGNSVFIVGPNPEARQTGGVARHMTVLAKLPALKNATIFDPGSTGGFWQAGALVVAGRCLKLRQLIAKGNYDQVWVNTSIYPSAFIKLLLILISLGNIKGVTVRVFFHGGRFEEIFFLHTRLLCKIARKILGQAKARHFLSFEQGRGFERTFPGLSWELYSNFLPTDIPLKRLPDSKIILLFVGRLVKEKGIYEILAAVDELNQFRKLHDLVVWFVGDGPEMKALRFQAQLRPQGKVQVWGFLDGESLERVYQRSFAFLLPSSHQEGFPYVILEAMRAGLPVIASPIGAIPSIIKDGKNGFLIPSKNPTALAQAIIKLLDNPGLARRMGNNNVRKFRKKFSKQAANEYYTRLLSRDI